jgi:ribosomal protein S16
VRYWIERGAQPTATVDRLIKSQSKAQAAESADGAAAAA